jgi:hypothetical protein
MKKNKKVWKVKPTGSTESWSPEAKTMLKQIQNAKHYKNNRKLKRKIKDLKSLNPEMAFVIDEHFKQDSLKEFDRLLKMQKIEKQNMTDEQWLDLIVPEGR